MARPILALALIGLLGCSGGGRDAAPEPSIEAIRQIPIAAPTGALIPLGQLADLSIEEGPAQISRDRIQRRLTVEANVRARDLSGFVSEAQRRIEEANVLPAGYFLQWGGQFENLRKATERLIVAVPVALLLIFLLLYMIWRGLEGHLGEEACISV